MNSTHRLITALLVGASLLIGLPSLAQADDDDWGHLGINFSVGAPVYYGPPAYVYTPPPRVYYGPPRPVYYDRGYGYWHDRGRWHGRGHWRHHEHDDDDDD
ncbi:hypothetical protein ACFDAU_08765 [Sulfuriferula sp. GW1]|uniref:hypothetical protein n=1 Tax=Sulfuriferula sp. GW1 TaxID=3345111 RepID=UPI0039AEE053